MPNQTGQENTVFELFIRFAYVLVILVNALIVAGIGALWKSFKSFKWDIKEMIRTFMSGHTEKHETLDTQIETLFNRDRQDLDRLSRMEQGLDDQKDLCKDHRVHCSGRRKE